MAWLDLATLSATWGVASALGVSLLGVVSLGGGHSRPRGALAFGLFALVWGIHILAGSLLYVAPTAQLATVLYLTYFVSLLALPYFLVEFASAHAATPSAARWTVLRWTAAGAAVTAVLLFIADPALVFGGVEARGVRFFAKWGPVFVPLVMLPLFIALGIALHALAGAVRSAPTHRTRLRAATLLAGLGLFAGFTSGSSLTFYTIGSLMYPGSFGVPELLYTVTFAALGLLCASIGQRAWRSARRLTVPTERRLQAGLAAALLIPLAWGALEAMVGLLKPSPFNTVGLWRLTGVAIIAYGIARWRFYDLPQRAANAAATAGGTAVAAATGATVFGAGSLYSTSAAPAVAGVLVVAAALVPSVRLVRRLFARRLAEPAAPLDQQLYGQRIEAYRAALEASLARGTLDEDEAFLGALRGRFEISESEDRVLRYYARSSVIVPRSQHAWDAYDRLRLLGEGGGGRTWLARDRARDRLVVLKEPLERWHQEPGAREAVLREARLAARVRHPHVVAVEEVLEGKSSPIIVMEYLEGGSLADVLRARQRLPWQDAVSLMQGVLAGVEGIHAAGVVHRDVKPSNVLLTSDGTPKIADFGIAVNTLTSGKTQVMDVGPGTIAGTLAYMAPEVRAGLSQGDRRSDVYACAALLHELVHGSPPGVAGLAFTPSLVPAELAAVIARGLAERPEARFPSARAFADELARVPRT